MSARPVRLRHSELPLLWVEILLAPSKQLSVSLSSSIHSNLQQRVNRGGRVAFWLILCTLTQLLSRRLKWMDIDTCSGYCGDPLGGILFCL